MGIFLFPDPYSLGILIEWKRQSTPFGFSHLLNNPYSLGILIEWKHNLPQFEMGLD